MSPDKQATARMLLAGTVLAGSMSSCLPPVYAEGLAVNKQPAISSPDPSEKNNYKSQTVLADYRVLINESNNSAITPTVSEGATLNFSFESFASAKISDKNKLEIGILLEEGQVFATKDAAVAGEVNGNVYVANLPVKIHYQDLDYSVSISDTMAGVAVAVGESGKVAFPTVFRAPDNSFFATKAVFVEKNNILGAALIDRKDTVRDIIEVPIAQVPEGGKATINDKGEIYITNTKGEMINHFDQQKNKWVLSATQKQRDQLKTVEKVSPKTEVLQKLFTPAAETTKTQEVVVCGRLTVKQDIQATAINVRSGPGTDYSVLGILPKDWQGDITYRTEDSQWGLVNIKDKNGNPVENGQGRWVSLAADLVDVTCSRDQIPVAPANLIPKKPTPPPETAKVVEQGVNLGLEYIHQTHNLSCESALMASILKRYGVSLGENDVLARLKPAANPHEGFRGNVDGPVYGVVDYGVYGEPLAEMLNNLGIPAHVEYGGNIERVRQLLKERKTAIVWMSKLGQPPVKEKDAKSGKEYVLVPGEHVWLAGGYASEQPGTPINWIDPYWGPVSSNSVPEWGYYNNMMLVINKPIP